MISGANEEELEMASVRTDIMIALDTKYGNYDLLDKLDKYQENEKQQLIKFLENKIKEFERNNEYAEIYTGSPNKEANIKIELCQEVLDFIRGNKDEVK